MILNKIKLANLFLFIILFFILEYFYSTFLIDLYAYRGFYLDFNLIRYIESKILFLVMIACVTTIKMDDFIYSVSNIFIVFFVTPSLIVYQFMSDIRLIPYSVCLLVAMIIFSSFLIPNIKLPSIKLSQRYIVMCFIAVFLFIPFVLVYGFESFNLYNLLFQDIYITRLLASHQRTFFTSYMYVAFAHFILPFILIVSFKRKKYFIVALSFCAIIYLFLTHSHKMTLLSLLLVLFFLGFKGGYVKKTFIFIVTIICMIFIGSVIDLVLPYPIFTDVIIYRSLFVPSLLNVFYFEFFDNNYIYWSDSFLDYIISYNFDLIPANRIGLEYLGSELSNAGNGLISNGYMNFDFIGIFFNSLLVSGYFCFFKLCKISSDYFALFVIMIIALIGGPPLSFLLTGGGLLLIMLCIFFIDHNYT